MASENLILALKKKDITINKLRAEIQRLKNRQPHHDEQSRKEHQRLVDLNNSYAKTVNELRSKIYDLESQRNIPEAWKDLSPEEIREMLEGYKFFKELEAFFGER